LRLLISMTSSKNSTFSSHNVEETNARKSLRRLGDSRVVRRPLGKGKEGSASLLSILKREEAIYVDEAKEEAAEAAEEEEEEGGGGGGGGGDEEETKYLLARC